MAKHIFVGVHGMLVSDSYEDQNAGYEHLLTALECCQPSLIGVFPPHQRAYVNWAQDLPDQTVRDDQKLRLAEKFMCGKIGTQHSRPTGKLGINPLIDKVEEMTLRRASNLIKDQIFTYGMTDVLYYAGEGEKRVRETVFDAMAAAVGSTHNDYEGVSYLHLFGHSQGATICHDVLFALFNTTRHDSFAHMYQAATVDNLTMMRGLADAGKLKLGSWNTVGSQIALNVVRSQALVDRFYEGKCIDTRQIGFDPDGPVVWNNFYDRDDVLGYPVRGLYGDCPAIAEYEVDTGLLRDAHIRYWENARLLETAAQLVAARVHAL